MPAFRRAQGLAAIGMAAILLAACGSSKSTSATTSAAAPSTTSTASSSRTSTASPSTTSTAAPARSTPLWSPSAPERRPSAQELLAAGLDGFGPIDERVLAALLNHPTKAATTCLLHTMGLANSEAHLEWLVIALKHHEAAALRAVIRATIVCARQRGGP